MEHICRPSAAAVAIGYRSLLNRSVYEGASPLSPFFLDYAVD